MTAIECGNVDHTYPGIGEPVHALRDVSFSAAYGETITLSGPSGCGKSTLLSLITGLQRPTAGDIAVDGQPVTSMTERQLLAFRARHIGVVVQTPSRVLLAHSNAEDNVEFARSAVKRNERANLPDPKALLRELGLLDLLGRKAGSMSGGEQQRLAVAVALANLPRVLVADEPTSQLDDGNRDLVVELFKNANREWGTTILVVSHDPAVARAFHRVIRLDNGAIAS